MRSPMMRNFPSRFLDPVLRLPRILVGMVLAGALAFGQARGQEALPGASSPLSGREVERFRSEIRTALFVPDALPALKPETHGRFEPTPGVVAERITYGTQ